MKKTTSQLSVLNHHEKQLLRYVAHPQANQITLRPMIIQCVAGRVTYTSSNIGKVARLKVTQVPLSLERLLKIAICQIELNQTAYKYLDSLVTGGWLI
jgi:hypothetical protein